MLCKFLGARIANSVLIQYSHLQFTELELELKPKPPPSSQDENWTLEIRHNRMNDKRSGIWFNAAMIVVYLAKDLKNPHFDWHELMNERRTEDEENASMVATATI